MKHTLNRDILYLILEHAISGPLHTILPLAFISLEFARMVNNHGRWITLAGDRLPNLMQRRSTFCNVCWDSTCDYSYRVQVNEDIDTYGCQICNCVIRDAFCDTLHARVCVHSPTVTYELLESTMPLRAYLYRVARTHGRLSETVYRNYYHSALRMIELRKALSGAGVLEDIKDVLDRGFLMWPTMRPGWKVKYPKAQYIRDLKSYVYDGIGSTQHLVERALSLRIVLCVNCNNHAAEACDLCLCGVCCVELSSEDCPRHPRSR